MTEENREGGLDEERMQELAQRDQLWASLRALLPEIEPDGADFGPRGGS
jgi:hypothetical protein